MEQDPMDLYARIVQEDIEMTKIGADGGSATIVDRMKSFVETSQENFHTLWKAELYNQAEWLRTLAYHWAGIYELKTGISISPGILRAHLESSEPR